MPRPEIGHDTELDTARRDWEMLADRLRAKEQMLVTKLAEHMQNGKPFPFELFADVKAARVKCNAAFHHLMDVIERRATGMSR